MSHTQVFDFLVIGSGFGGSVSAHRLTEKGYKVAVLEKGRRFRSEDFPKTNWDVRKYLWAPFFKCFGIQNITFFKNVFVLSGVGVGGGSLVYANTLVKPKSPVFKDPVWSQLADWESELSPHYEMARKMLGAAKNEFFNEGDAELKKLGHHLGVGDTHASVDVAVYFGEPNKKVADPYFGGKGPDREGCNFCGGCMVGCRYNAKNTLDKNYLYLAERAGAKVFPETEVRRVIPQEDGSYLVETFRPGSWLQRFAPSVWPRTPHRTFRARKVVFAGGVLGSVKLLLENKYIHKTLPRLSNQLGHTVRTNGESIVGSTAIDSKIDYSKGLAITSSIQPDEKTKIEIVRYPKGSDFMKVLAAPLVGPGGRITRPLKALAGMAEHFFDIAKLWIHRTWAESTIILLVMQAVDNQIALGIQRRWYSFFRKSFGAIDTKNTKIEAYIAVANKSAEYLSQEIRGVSQMAFSEAFFNAPATAHILGGAKIGANESEGVVNKKAEVFNYPGLYVIDGSIIPANLGVNPSLTITALAEYAMSHIPVKS